MYFYKNVNNFDYIKILVKSTCTTCYKWEDEKNIYLSILRKEIYYFLIL